ncbi:MAG: MaoC family dehydratase N-terminal domain-containing protein [Gemmataceae bacterium]|nr:MaoC family dehydratase N-terminal domain-containing protein [Gemmataceae bacterium]
MTTAERSPTAAREAAQPYLNQWGPYRLTRDPVTAPLMWRYLEMSEDANPVYWDEEFAKKSSFGRIIAPPHAIMAFTFAPWWQPEYVTKKLEDDAAAMSEGAASGMGANQEVTRLGYTTATMVGSDFEYIAPFGEGDGRIKSRGRTTDVSVEKQTRPGKGVFITSETEYRTEVGDRLVARSTLTLLMYDGTTPRGDQ